MEARAGAGGDARALRRGLGGGQRGVARRDGSEAVRAEAGGSERATAATKPFLRVRGDDEALHRRPLYRLISHLGTLTGGAALFTPPPLIPSLYSMLKRASQKSALEAGDGKPEPGATLIVMRPYRSAAAPSSLATWHDERSQVVRG